MTLIPSLTSPNYEWFPWSICNGCGMPAGNAYPSGHLVPSPPHFGTCLCSNCLDQIPRTCHGFTRIFTSNTLWYFLDFPYIQNRGNSKNPFYLHIQTKICVYLLKSISVFWKFCGVPFDCTNVESCKGFPLACPPFQ